MEIGVNGTSGAHALVLVALAFDFALASATILRRHLIYLVSQTNKLTLAPKQTKNTDQLMEEEFAKVTAKNSNCATRNCVQI